MNEFSLYSFTGLKTEDDTWGRSVSALATVNRVPFDQLVNCSSVHPQSHKKGNNSHKLKNHYPSANNVSVMKP